MTEHCVNNDTSICQTPDATHLILTYDMFKANKTIGHTYYGERAELAFHLAADPEAPIYRLKLFVANHTDRVWNVLLYENPHDYASASSITTLAAKSERQLYTLREFEFSKKEEILVFFRFGDRLFDIEPEESHRLWKCLNYLHEQPVFADVTVSNDAGDYIPAHRAIIAAATQALRDTISSLEPIAFNEQEGSVKSEPVASSSDAAASDNGDDGDDPVAKSHDDQNLEEAFAAFANAVIQNEKPEDKKALMENLKETIEDALDIKIQDNNASEMVIEQPNPNRFKLVVNGLRPRKNLEEFLRNVYTGKFMKPKAGDDDHVEFIRKLDDMLSVIYLLNMTQLVKIIESMLKTCVKEHTAVDLLQMANQYDLMELKSKVLQFIRSPEYINILEGVKDTMVHKCIIAKPSHKNQSQFHSVFAVNVSKVWPKFKFYLCGIHTEIELTNETRSGIYFVIKIQVSSNRNSKHFVGLLINDLKLTVQSDKVGVEHVVLRRQGFIVKSSKVKTLAIMQYSDFKDKTNGYYTNNILKGELFLEANTDWPMY